MKSGNHGEVAALQRYWRRRRGSLLISLAVTLAALGIYFATFLGERPTPVFDFIARLELDALDARFRLRGRLEPDPRIVIVDVDQRSQEQLGRWPFPHTDFARLLDRLREDGAQVVAFDITFSQPEKSAEPLDGGAATASKKQQGSAKPELTVAKHAEEEPDPDKEFAESIRRFGRVVLGNYFLYSRSDLKGMPRRAIERYANLLAYFPFPRVQPLPSTDGEQDRLGLIQQYEDMGLLPRGAEANTAELTAALSSDNAGTGFFNVPADADGVVRRYLLALPYGQGEDRSQWDFYPSLDVQAVRLFLNAPAKDTILFIGPVGISSVQLGQYLQVKPDPIGRLGINFRGPVRTYPYISFGDAVQGRFPVGTFRNKLVLVGVTATGIGDLRATPFGGLDFPGVEVHANVIDNLLSQDFIERGPKEVVGDVFAILAFGLLLGLWLAISPPAWLPATLLLLFPFTAVLYGAFVRGAWLNFTVPALFTLIPNLGLVALYRVLVEEKEKRRVRTAFQHYVSPEVIRRVLDEPGLLQPRKREITVMFADIRGFTKLAESLDAQVLSDILNRFMTEMTRVIFRQRGTLDKYVGDSVVSLWGAPFEEPDHAVRACRAALEMAMRLEELRAEFTGRGWPQLYIGIGINTGMAAVGNMGSELRYAYTAMGDAVNLASRLEGLNKEYGTRILVSESTFAQLPGNEFRLRKLDWIRVQGRARPVLIYELMAIQSREGHALAAAFERALDTYVRREWDAAAEAFGEITARWREDGPSRIFLVRVNEYRAAPPPPEWDGVHVMKSK
jgi:adenylate cyclase